MRKSFVVCFYGNANLLNSLTVSAAGRLLSKMLVTLDFQKGPLKYSSLFQQVRVLTSAQSFDIYFLCFVRQLCVCVSTPHASTAILVDHVA